VITTTVNISERQLRLGVFKLALSLVAIIILLGTVAAFLEDRGQHIAINTLIFSGSFSFFTSGIYAGMKCIDWLQARGMGRHV
jgi:hypothetical protein